MAAPFVQQEHQFPAHQPQAQQYLPGPPLAAQRSQSVGNAPPPPAQQSPFSMGNMNRTPQGPGYPPPTGPQQLPPPVQAQLVSHPQPPPQALHPRQPLKPRFQIGPSPAAIAYQLSQQMQQYQGGFAPATDIYGHTPYQQPATFYDPYGQPYVTFAQDPQGAALVPMPYSPSYPHPPYPVPAGSLPAHHVGQEWYPPPQQQQPAPYYYPPPVNYSPQPLAIHQGPLGQPQLYPCGPEQFRRHSMPVRHSNSLRGPEPEGAGPPGGYYFPPTMRNVAGGVKSAPTFVNTPSPQPSPPSVPRGPPRKPKQSGYALWVGNLPPLTDVAALKDYFASEARDEIESVFLISKSNCAFVNYRTEAACDEAMTRFHNSKFRGTRLVCRPRPRKGSAAPMPETGEPTASVDVLEPASGDEEGITVDGVTPVGGDPSPVDANKAPPTGPAGGKAPRLNSRYRYFILKSLTVEDLEMSVRNGVWATQSHNETALNQAFDAAESVFLIFSANKSGEYYGYARMMSKISSEPSGPISWNPPSGQPDPSSTELPRAIYTAATETAPKGRIIDDSARGTIFWEALSDDEGDSDAGKDDGDEEVASGKAVSKAWGKPFKVEWISTSRVPFYRTRGLRNSLNSGREVKVARDGTELEEGAGRRLVQMFHLRNMPVASHNSTPPR